MKIATGYKNEKIVNLLCSSLQLVTTWMCYSYEMVDSELSEYSFGSIFWYHSLESMLAQCCALARKCFTFQHGVKSSTT